MRARILRSFFIVGTLSGEVDYKEYKYPDPTALEIALENAAITGNSAQVQSLLQAGINPDMAVWDEHVVARVMQTTILNKEEIVTLFLDAGLDPNNIYADDVPILWLAVDQGDLEMVRLLLAYGAATNILYNRMPLLIRALRYNNKDVAPDLQERYEDIVQELLAAGADPNRADYFGVLPLKVALDVENRILAQALLDYGAEAASLDEIDQVKLERLLHLPVYFF